MDAVSIINKNIDVEKLLQHYDFNKIQSDSDIVRACCKLHGGDNPTSFVIARDTGLWYCHTGSCGGGDVFTLIQQIENISFKESVRWLASFFDVDIKNLEIVEKQYSYIKDLKNFIKLMKGKRKKTFTTFTIKEEIKEVATFRNFLETTIKHFELGYVESVQLTKRDGKHYTLRHRLVFPIYFKNIRIGISFRRTKSKDYPKWSHQPINIEMKNILYNYDNIQGQQTIVVCEGIADVWAFHEIGVPAVATFGAHITQEQYKLLLYTGADLVFAFDGDDAGRLVTEHAIKKFKYKANIFIISFNEGEDPESIKREELRKKYGRKQKC